MMMISRSRAVMLLSDILSRLIVGHRQPCIERGVLLLGERASQESGTLGVRLLGKDGWRDRQGRRGRDGPLGLVFVVDLIEAPLFNALHPVVKQGVRVGLEEVGASPLDVQFDPKAGFALP